MDSTGTFPSPIPIVPEENTGSGTRSGGMMRPARGAATSTSPAGWAAAEGGRIEPAEGRWNRRGSAPDSAGSVMPARKPENAAGPRACGLGVAGADHHGQGGGGLRHHGAEHRAGQHREPLGADPGEHDRDEAPVQAEDDGNLPRAAHDGAGQRPQDGVHDLADEFDEPVEQRAPPPLFSGLIPVLLPLRRCAKELRTSAGRVKISPDLLRVPPSRLESSHVEARRAV